LNRDLRVEHVYSQWLEGKKFTWFAGAVRPCLSVHGSERLEQSDNRSTNAPHMLCASNTTPEQRPRGAAVTQVRLKFQAAELVLALFLPK